MGLWVNRESCNFYSQHVYMYSFFIQHGICIHKHAIYYMIKGQSLKLTKLKKIIITHSLNTGKYKETNVLFIFQMRKWDWDTDNL